MAGKDDEMFMTRSFSITPKTTEQHLIARSDKSVAYRPHSIILASCKPVFRPGLQPGFRQVRAGLRHAFDTLSTFLSKTWSRSLLHQSRHVEIDAAGSLVRARSRQMKCRKKPISRQPTNLLKLDFRYVFYYSCLSCRN